MEVGLFAIPLSLQPLPSLSLGPVAAFGVATIPNAFLVTLCHLSKVYGIIGDLSILKSDFSDKKLLIAKIHFM